MKTIMIHIHAIRRIKHPFLEGMGSVINISGKHNAYNRFVRGNAVSDMRKDRETVGLSISEEERKANGCGCTYPGFM